MKITVPLFFLLLGLHSSIKEKINLSLEEQVFSFSDGRKFDLKMLEGEAEE